MSLQTTFNGVRLVKPGAASRVISKLQNKGIPGTGTLAVIGTAKGGPIGLSIWTDPDKMRAAYRSGDLADAAGIPWNASNDPDITGRPNQVLAYRVAGAGVASATSNALVNATDNNLIVLTAKDFGVYTNRISVVWGATANVLQLSIADGLQSFTETSPALAGAKFTVTYAGAGSDPSYTVTGTTFSTTVTGAAGDILSLDLSVYQTVGDVIAAINTNTNYTATLSSGSNPAFPSANLDRITGATLSSTATVTAQVQDVIDWVNQNSTLASAAREATGAITGMLKASVAKVYFTGGNDGVTPVAQDWIDALNTMKVQRVHALVPLYDSGALMDDIIAAAAAYATQMNSTAGKNEVQVYIGENTTKSTALARATVTLNDPNITYCFQRHTLTGADGILKVFPAWSSALLTASMRVSAPLGEPLTFKYLRSFGLTQDVTFDLKNDMDQLILAGICVHEVVPGKGTRIVKGNTTYTKTDDDGYTEESVVFSWKAISYDLRGFLEDLYCGKRGTPATISAIADDVGAKLEEYRKAEVIIDSQDDAGTPLHAWRDVRVTAEKDKVEIAVTITVAEGINFILPTIYLAPVKLTA